MHQVIQNIRNGRLSVITLPEPLARPGHVLIANACSLVSAGTEKMAMELAKKSLLGKAGERPDHVQRVLQKLRNECLFNTIAQVREKLDEPMSMGYSSAGVVCVPKHLCARVPDNVPFEQTAFTVIGAIALQGVRLARLGLGDTAFVKGLRANLLLYWGYYIISL